MGREFHHSSTYVFKLQIGANKAINKVTEFSLFRASDRVRQKMGNSAAFSREIKRQKRAIMRQIMRFF